MSAITETPETPCPACGYRAWVWITEASYWRCEVCWLRTDNEMLRGHVKYLAQVIKHGRPLVETADPPSQVESGSPNEGDRG